VFAALASRFHTLELDPERPPQRKAQRRAPRPRPPPPAPALEDMPQRACPPTAHVTVGVAHRRCHVQSREHAHAISAHDELFDLGTPQQEDVRLSVGISQRAVLQRPCKATRGDKEPTVERPRRRSSFCLNTSSSLRSVGALQFYIPRENTTPLCSTVLSRPRTNDDVDLFDVVPAVDAGDRPQLRDATKHLRNEVFQQLTLRCGLVAACASCHKPCKARSGRACRAR
jgi:hypothetical protein